MRSRSSVSRRRRSASTAARTILQELRRNSQDARPAAAVVLEPLEPRLMLSGAAISGAVWKDYDGDGLRDAGEDGLAQATVYLDLDGSGTWEQGEPWQLTGEDGGYLFDGLDAGTYQVRQLLGAGWSQTNPNPRATLAAVDCDNNLLRLYNAQLSPVQTIAIPEFEDDWTGWPRDVAIGDDGRIHVFNGTATPRLSTYDPATGQWSHLTIPGWQAYGTTYYGGIACSEGYVFVADTRSSSNYDEPQGLIRIDPDTGEYTLAEGTAYSDVTAGLDGLIYALTGANSLHVFDPLTMERVRTFSLTQYTVRSIAVDQQGYVYTPMFVFSPQGRPVNSLQCEPEWVTSPRDIDMAPNGQLIIASGDGPVVVSNASRTHFTKISPGGYFYGCFATWRGNMEATPATVVPLAAEQTAAGVDFGAYQMQADRPVWPILTAESDTGSSQTDGVTRRNNSDASSALSFGVGQTIPGARVELYLDETLAAWTLATGTTTILTTDGASTLPNGTYTVTAVQRRDGFMASDASDSRQITIDYGEPRVTIDRIVVENTRPLLSGTVFDADADVQVTIDGATYTAESLADGAWRFRVPYDLPAGVYDVTVSVEDIAGNTAADFTSDEVVIAAPDGGIVGTVWMDTDGNGLRDAGEAGMPGVKVFLDLDRDGEWSESEPFQLTAGDNPATVDIDEAGTYAFASLPNGDYVVRQIVSDGYELTTASMTWNGYQRTEMTLPGYPTDTGLTFQVFGDMLVLPRFEPDYSVEIYRYQDGEWIFEQSLKCPDPHIREYVGSFHADGDVLAVTARGRDRTYPGYDSGAAYVYRRTGGIWQLEATIEHPTLEQQAYFPSAVAVCGDVLAIGDYTHTQALIYHYDGSQWNLEQTIQRPAESDEDSLFALSLHLRENWLAIDAKEENVANEIRAGASYLYHCQDGQWVLHSTLTALVPDYANYFRARAMGDGWIVATEGANAWVFELEGNTWTLKDNLRKPAAFGTTYWPSAVAADDDTILIYSSGESGIATAGGAFVFERIGGEWEMTQRLYPEPFSDNFAEGTAVSEHGIFISSSPTRTIPGDFTGDGEVTGADYNRWSTYVGDDEDYFAPGSTNGDGVVTGADYVLWASNFGASAAVQRTPVLYQYDSPAAQTGELLVGVLGSEATADFGNYPATLAAAGDFNGDGQISGADYTLWADCFGGGDALLAPGSHNGDGHVSGADYVLWASIAAAAGTESQALTAAQTSRPALSMRDVLASTRSVQLDEAVLDLLAVPRFGLSRC